MKELIRKLEILSEKSTEETTQYWVDFFGDVFSIPVLEELLKHYKQVEKKILSEDLLEWMQENDLDTIENERFKITIATYVSAKIQDPDAAFKWLEKHQYGDLIKDTVDFAKGEFTQEVGDSLDSLGVSYTKKSGIRPQSLKKIMSDRYYANESLPDETEGIAVKYYDECKVKEK